MSFIARKSIKLLTHICFIIFKEIFSLYNTIDIKTMVH